jgi:hypothetical protein
MNYEMAIQHGVWREVELLFILKVITLCLTSVTFTIQEISIQTRELRGWERLGDLLFVMEALVGLSGTNSLNNNGTHLHHYYLTHYYYCLSC